MNTTDKKSLLVVGAGGFIGGFICAESIRRGYDTYAGVRSSTSRRYLTSEALKITDFNYEDPAVIEKQMKEAAPEGGWDTIIYNLGATKCANFADFNRINYQFLKNFTEALQSAGLKPRRFLYMSSLSALGNLDDPDYTPADAKTIPHPNTRYGLSKIKAETHLETVAGLPWTIFRPTGVYGPHERDYLMMVKSIDNHFDFGIGYRRQMLTFIYVKDLVGAMFDALATDKTIRRKYIISEPRAYTQSEFRRIVAKALGRKFVIPVRLPIWIVYLASVIAEKWSALSLKASTLNRDKFKIMRQRNWTCSVADAEQDFGFKTDYPLERGIAATVEAYLKEKKNKK